MASSTPATKSKAAQKKPPQTQRKSAKSQAKAEDGSTDEEDNKESYLKVRVNWNIEICQAIVATILENQTVRQKLYPSPGPNPSAIEGGGMKKSEAHWEICVAIFTDHEEYGDVFKAALKAQSARDIKKHREPWTRAIKGQLQWMELKTNEIRTAMGKTGMGLTKANDINMELDSDIINAWKKTPWFFDFHDIIGEHPNIVLAGIGNSAAGFNIDQDLLGINDADLDSSSGAAPSDTNNTSGLGDGNDNEIEKFGSAAKKRKGGSWDIESEDEEIVVVDEGKQAKQANDTPKPSRKTGPQKSNTKPAETPAKRPKKIEDG
ncbi:hypothetical protein PM082_023851 [Marasmius tenuissimus]|nr:hypothetical protein PM082_023851 [Marasmius tenuissimus]